MDTDYSDKNFYRRLGRERRFFYRNYGVRNIEKATAKLKKQGYKLLVATQEEAWGQVVTRLLGPEGLLVGITHTPGMRK